MSFVEIIMVRVTLRSFLAFQLAGYFQNFDFKIIKKSQKFFSNECHVYESVGDVGAYLRLYIENRRKTE